MEENKLNLTNEQIEMISNLMKDNIAQLHNKMLNGMIFIDSWYGNNQQQKIEYFAKSNALISNHWVHKLLKENKNN
jgi:hypothetical protein